MGLPVTTLFAAGFAVALLAIAAGVAFAVISITHDLDETEPREQRLDEQLLQLARRERTSA
jgi:hypothetical protein